MTLPLPRNAGAIVQARMAGKRPELPVIVSYVGSLVTPCPVVYADSAKAYDWEFLTGLATAIAVRPGIDATNAMCGLLERMEMHYPMVFDIERRECFSLIRLQPRPNGFVYAWDSDFGPPATLLFGVRACT